MTNPPVLTVQQVHKSRLNAAPIYDSARRAPRFFEAMAEAWNYRDLIYQLIARDITVRYKRSVLGVAWTMLHPLLMMVTVTMVFSYLFRFDIHHFPVYFLAGMVIWTFFAQSTTSAMMQLMWGGRLLNRIYIPKTIFAFSALGVGLVNLVLSLVPLAAIMLLTDLPLSPVLLWLPIPIALSAIFALGVGLILSTLAVAFHDVADMYQVLVSIWYFLTPIMYPVSIIPPEARWWLHVNPLYYLVTSFRAPIYDGAIPAPEITLIAAASALGALLLGWWMFTAVGDEITYYL